MSSVRATAWPVVVAVTLSVTPAAGQTVELGSPLEDAVRLLQITGLTTAPSFTVRPLLGQPFDYLATPGAHPWSAHFQAPPSGSGDLRWRLGESRIRLFANTDHPWVENDGAVWQGRGLTTALDTRGTVRWRALSATFNPTLIHNQNASFALAPVGVPGQSEYAYPWRRIDLPQRFGPESFWTFDPGQSEVAVEVSGARLSVGTRNLWWGPGIRHAILMSNNGPGFFHGSLATARPLDIGIGTLEGQWIWGRPGQSEWFDPTMADRDRFFTGLVVTYSPSVLPGLSVGVTRVFQELIPDTGLDFGEYFVVFQSIFKSSFASDGDDGTDERDQLASVFARWVMPESGFEAYMEWARTDHSGDLADFLQEPEHSRGYLVGFQKVTSRSARRFVVLRGEVTHLEASPTFQLRPRPTYYEHSVVTEGYTHRGQVIGAGVGPGGNAQYLGTDLISAEHSWGVSVERRVIDNDAFWEFSRDNGLSFDRHHVQLNLGVRGARHVGRLEVGGGFVLTRELNRYFDDDEGWNGNFHVTARWRGWSGR